MDVNLPDVASEVRAVFDSYEKALTDNDVAALTRLFWDSPMTLRYGAAENLYGADEIHAFRAARPSGPRPRELLSVRIASSGWILPLQMPSSGIGMKGGLDDKAKPGSKLGGNGVSSQRTYPTWTHKRDPNQSARQLAQ